MPAPPRDELQGFLVRAFARSAAGVAGAVPGRPLGGAWRAAVEYRLAELGYGLPPEIAIHGVPGPLGESERHALHRDGGLLVSGLAVRAGRFSAAFLRLDLPHALVDLPACACGSAPEERVAARLAAAYLSLSRDSEGRDGEAGPPEALLARLAAWVTRHGPPRARSLLAQRGPEILRLAHETLERVPAGLDRGVGVDGAPLPVFPVTPALLTRFGIPPRAVEWVADHYGWTHTAEGWDSGFLPLQVLGVARGLLDRDRFLHRSGVIAAATSAGKTLLAELRMLARWFHADGRPKRTVFLVPTRELGAERAAQLRAAYGTALKERRLRVCYSDGEHHGDDGALREGRFDVAVLVNEKLKYFQQSPRFLADVGEVVLDELGTMSEESRGPYLEVAFAGLLRAHKGLTVLGLTRPTRGLEPVLDAMEAGEGAAFLLETVRRPIPIACGIWAPEDEAPERGMASYRDCNTGERREEPLTLAGPTDPLATLKALVVRFLRQTEAERRAGRRNNLLIAVPTKTHTMLLARHLAGLHREDAEVREILDGNASTGLIPARLRGLEPSYRRSLLEETLPRGIGFHDADLAVAERRVVGQAFRDGEIPVLISTRTTACGINLPAQAIVFLNWGERPGYGGAEAAGEPFYRGLEHDLITWLGRVGRFGKRAHRTATALYVAREGPGSEEYDTIHRLLAEQAGPFTVHLAASPSFQEPVLAAVADLTQGRGRVPTREEIVEHLLLTPSAAGEAGRVRVREGAAAGLAELAAFDGQAPLRPVPRDEETGFELTPLGQIAHQSGVRVETCRRLHDWLLRGAGRPLVTWDPLDLLALVLATPDGQALEPLRPPRFIWSSLREEYGFHVDTRWLGANAGWRERSPLLHAPVREIGKIATVLALRDWRHGLPLLPDERRDLPGIEWRYGLQYAGCSIWDRARDLARLLRVLAALAQILPEGTYPAQRPEGLPGLAEGEVAVPWDLEALADEILHGMPHAAVPLARLPVDGLTRSFALSLYRAVEERGTAPDLPLLERAQALARDEADAFAAALPTHGLRERVKEALQAHGRLPLAERLREGRETARRFYAHPLVTLAQLLQGRDRYTALRVMHRRLYSVIRRNTSPGEPLVLKTDAEVGHWVGRGALEFLAEVGRPFEDGYRVDRFLVDLDPQHGYALNPLRRLAAEVARRLGEHEWADPEGVLIQWTGGKGFHIIAPFRHGVFRPVEAVRRVLEALVLRLQDDVSLFVREQPDLTEPHVVLDLSPVMRRGVYRNAFSLHAGTGGVCVPVEPARLARFDPEREATPDAVLAVLERLAPVGRGTEAREEDGAGRGEAEAPHAGPPPLSWEALLRGFWAEVRAVHDPDPALPPLPPVPAAPRRGGPTVLPSLERRPFRPEGWSPVHVTRAAQVEALLPELGRADRVGLDLETTAREPRAGQIRLLSLATATGVWVLDCAAVRPEPVLALLRGKELVGHNLLFDLGRLYREYGWEPRAADDTLIFSQLLHAGEQRGRRGVHTLAGVVKRHLGCDLPKELQGSDWSGALTPEQIDYAARDAAVLLPLRERLWERLRAADLERVARIERRCLPAVVWMSAAGMPVDAERWEGQAREDERERDHLRRVLDAAAPPAPGYELGLGWNWDRPAGIRDALRLAGCEVTGTDDASLAALDHPLADLIRRYRHVHSMAGTWGATWLRFAEGGRVYPDWRQLGAASGRLISRRPNVQGTPRARRAAVTAPPGRVLVRGDYAQLHARIVARISGDAALLRAFREGRDPYAEAARRLLGSEQVGPEERQVAKAVALGFLFGMETETFRRYARAEFGLSLGEEEATRYRQTFFAHCPGVAEWHRAVRRERTEETRSLSGRRLLLEANAPDTARCNGPVQGTEVDGLKRALALLWERREGCPSAVPVLAAHDEILIECDAAQAGTAGAWLRQAMRDGMAPLLRPVPVEVRVTVARAWGGDGNDEHRRGER